MKISLLKMSEAGVTFADFPVELQLKILSQLNLAQILSMLRIHPWKEAILDYLTIEVSISFQVTQTANIRREGPARTRATTHFWTSSVSIKNLSNFLTTTMTS